MPTRERWDALLAQGYADAEAALPLLLERGFTEKPTEAAASSERAVPLPGTARGRSRSRSRSAKNVNLSTSVLASLDEKSREQENFGVA